MNYQKTIKLLQMSKENLAFMKRDHNLKRVYFKSSETNAPKSMESTKETLLHTSSCCEIGTALQCTVNTVMGHQAIHRTSPAEDSYCLVKTCAKQFLVDYVPSF